MPQADPRQPRLPQRPPTAKHTPGPIRQRAECRPPQPQPTGWESEAAQHNPAQQSPQAGQAQQGVSPANMSPKADQARPPKAPANVSPMPLLPEDEPATTPAATGKASPNEPNPSWQAVPASTTPVPSADSQRNDKPDFGAQPPTVNPNTPSKRPGAANKPSDQSGKKTPGIPRYTIRDRQRPRIVSLDVARGVMLMVSVLSASLITIPLPHAFTHAPWFGVHFLDLVFPVFVTMSGVGFAFAYSRRVRLVVVLRRAVVLILLGLGYTALTTQTYNLANLRFTGVLQLYGVLALFQGLLHWKFRTWKAWFRWTTLLTILLTALHVAWPPLICEMGGLTQTCNPSLYIDVNLFGTAHMYENGITGHDPEGVVSILGALLSMSAGTTLGHLLLQARRTSQRPLQAISFLLMYCAALGAGLSLVVEPFKRLWTPSFALLACIPALAIVVIFWLILDRPDADTTPSVPYYLRPLVSLGKNSLFVYFGSHLFMAMALNTGSPGNPPWPVILGERIGYEPWGLGVACVLAWTLLAMVLDRYKIYIRA